MNISFSKYHKKDFEDLEEELLNTSRNINDASPKTYMVDILSKVLVSIPISLFFLGIIVKVLNDALQALDDDKIVPAFCVCLIIFSISTLTIGFTWKGIDVLLRKYTIIKNPLVLYLRDIELMVLELEQYKSASKLSDRLRTEKKDCQFSIHYDWRSNIEEIDFCSVAEYFSVPLFEGMTYDHGNISFSELDKVYAKGRELLERINNAKS